MLGVQVAVDVPPGGADGEGVVGVGVGVGVGKPVVTEKVGFAVCEVDGALVVGCGVTVGVGAGTLPSDEIICCVAICIIGLSAR